MSDDSYSKELDDFKRTQRMRDEEDEQDNDQDFKRARQHHYDEEDERGRKQPKQQYSERPSHQEYCRNYPAAYPRILKGHAAAPAPRPISAPGYNNARGCKQGLSCRSRETCTFIHSNFVDDKINSWCGCFDLMCEFPHPNRNREPSKLKSRSSESSFSRNSSQSFSLPRNYICKMCKKPGHLIARCPLSTCFKCGEKGHMASVCSSV